MPSDKFSSLPEPAILGLVEGTSIQQVDLALRLLDEADDREKTHKNFEKLRRTQARRGGLIHFVRHFWSVLEPSTKLIEGWPLEAICLHLESAVCMCGPRQVKVRLDYIYSDGKPRRSGYSTGAEEGTSSSPTR